MFFLFYHKNKKKVGEKVISLLSKEVLYRSTYLVFCFLFSFLSSWIYGKEILYLYLYPLTILSQNCMFTSISEAFTTTLRLCIYVSFASSFPFLLYLSVCFFLPSLFPEERQYFYKIYIYVQISFISSLLLCSIYIIPELCYWFLKYGASTNFLHIYLNAKVSTYVSWSGKIYVFCICILQIPIGFWLFLNPVSGKEFVATLSTYAPSMHAPEAQTHKAHTDRMIGSSGKSVCISSEHIFSPDSRFDYKGISFVDKNIPLPLAQENMSLWTKLSRVYIKQKRSQKQCGDLNKKVSSNKHTPKEKLSENRKYIYISLLLFCATVSPPDLYNQSILFFFFLAIFEYILWYAFLEETVIQCRRKKAINAKFLEH